jgi:hypothetical protein
MILEIARKYAARVAQQYQLAKDFSGDAIDDIFSLMKLRRKIDLRIEPHPFLPEDFKEDPFALLIKRTGIWII